MNRLSLPTIGSLLCCLLLIGTIRTQAQTLTGTYSLPGMVNGNSITNLTDLATLLNNASNPVSGTVVFEFGSSYNAAGETFPVTFNTFTGSGNVVIRPAASVSTPLATAGSPSGSPLISLNTSTKVTFDGRSGGMGSSINWVFRNTTTSGSQPTFKFTSTTNDTLQYLQIESQNTSSTSGTVYFGPSACSYNAIQNCTIKQYASGNATHLNAIYFTGTTASPNNYNSILNNNISNFTPTINQAATGITVTGTSTNTNYGSNWTISGNSFYLNTTEQSNYQYIPINFVPGTGSSGNTIAGNYIGGTAPQCSGGTWTTAASGASGTNYTFEGIYVKAGATTISSNTIQSISLTGTSGVSFAGIYIIGGSSAYSITGNTIGSNTAANSIQNAGQWGIVGIWSEGTGAVSITNNTIANLTETNAVNAVAKTVGIYTGNGSNTITGNTVHDLTSACATGSSVYISTDAAAAGIVQNSGLSAAQTISNNTVYNINSSYSNTSNTRLYGIASNGIVTSAHVYDINANLVYNIYGNSSNANTSLTGIKILSGSHKVTNNIVRLGYRKDGSTVTAAAAITGIIDSSSGSNSMMLAIYHNSVYIGGTGVTGSTNTFAFRRVESNISPSNLDTIQNNIFENNRSNGSGTGKHYAIYLDRISNVLSNYNILYGAGTGFVTGGINGVDYSTLTSWATTFEDPNSIQADPQFISPDAATPDLHISNSPSTAPNDQAGTATYTVATDFDGLIRANYTPVDIGATVNCPSSGSNAGVTLVANDSSVCLGTQVTFTATATNGGTTPNYNFYVNGTSMQNGTGNTYSSTTLADHDSVWVVLTSNAPCISNGTATSTKVVMSVTSGSQAPSVTLSPSANNVCAGTSVTLTATPTNGGSAPTYNFYRNGSSVQNGASATYASSAFANGDTIRVVITSNAICVSTPTASSNTVTMVVKPNATSTVTQTVCNGQSYGGHTATGTFVDTFAAANGCDSIRTLHLTVLSPITSTVTTSICSGQSYAGHNASGTFTDTYTASNGCDSVRTLHLTVQSSIQTTVNQTICNGQTYAGHDSTGTYTDTLTATGGCDSIRTLHLTVLPATASMVTTSICAGQSYAGHNATGMYTDTYTASNGCDSVRTLDLTVLTVIQTSETQTVCAGQSYGGHNATGTYTDTLTATGGCDSIATLHLTVLPAYNDTIHMTACQGDTVLGHTAAGNYTDSLQSSTGCDSTVTIALTFNPLPATPTITQHGDTLIASPAVGYQWYAGTNGDSLLNSETSSTLALTHNGTYSVAITDSNGCSNISAAFSAIGVGIDEATSNTVYQVYPNPANNHLIVVVNTPHAEVFRLYDVLGHLVLEQTLDGTSTTINTATLSQGLYVYRIGALVGKVVVEHP